MRFPAAARLGRRDRGEVSGFAPWGRAGNGAHRDVAGWPVAAGILAGAAADAVLRDPRRFHPVALFGRAAAAAEAAAYASSKARGAVYTAGCVLAVTVPVALAWRLARGQGLRPGRRPPAARPVSQERLARLPVGRNPAARPVSLGRLAPAALTAAATWTCLGAASLGAEARRLAASLEAGDLSAARAVLPSLCGRDPAGLDEAGLARAAVESVAENTCDAAVAPLLWAAAAGPAGLAAYRAANTLDAMVGYRSDRYREFGWASARLDDVAGAAAARLTGMLAALCAAVAGGSPSRAITTMLRDGHRHPSPNAGRCEAAFAGALGVRLGGTNSYHGVAERRPELGDGRAPRAADIRRAVRLSQAVTWAAAVLAAALALAHRIPRLGRGVTARPRQLPGCDVGAAGLTTWMSPSRSWLGGMERRPAPGGKRCWRTGTGQWPGTAVPGGEGTR